MLFQRPAAQYLVFSKMKARERVIVTKEEFNKWAEKHGLSIEQASKVLGVSRSNGFKYANGSRPVSKPVAYGAEAIDLLSKTESIKLIQKRLA